VSNKGSAMEIHHEAATTPPIYMPPLLVNAPTLCKPSNLYCTHASRPNIG